MDRYPDMSFALPLHGPAGRLLAAAIASSGAKSLTRLGEDAGLSKFAASRAGRQLQDAGLLVPDERGYRFDEGHPLAELAMTVVWTLVGVKPPVDHGVLVLDRDEDDQSYLRDLPAELRLPGPPMDERRDSAISAVQARVVLGELAGLMQRVLEPEELAQRMFSQWQSQRARDFVHQTLHLGAASGAARHTLAAETSARLVPPREQVTEWTWSRAIALVWAEHRRLERTADLFAEAVAFAGKFQARREQLIDDAKRIARRRQLDEDDLQQMTDRANETIDLWEQSQGRFHGIGGFTAPRDVGSTGDQMIATVLRQLAGRYADLAQRMTDMSSAAPSKDSGRD